MTTSVDFPTPHIVPVNGVDLEVFEAGRENAGRPIVLCHGWPEHARTWRHQVPALVAAGYHVIVPNQRGYGNSSCPAQVTAYDLEALTGDLVALLDHFGYAESTFVGHDWGAFVVWGLALLHPDRVARVINLSTPYMDRGEIRWIDAMEAYLGPDNYLVHFNRQPGVADAVLDANVRRFLRNLYRTHVPATEHAPGMEMIALAQAQDPVGEPVLTEEDLGALVTAFQATGFTPSINWYRNLDRNWHLLGTVDPVIPHPALMIYGDRDPVMRNEGIAATVPHVEVVTLDSGHWIPEERPDEVNEVIVSWLEREQVA